MTNQQSAYSIGVRFWIKSGDRHFLGRGRVELLEHIRDKGSIMKGAKAMKMSYRQAWQMVKDMNELMGKPLVEIMLGGKGGGGAIITPAGERAIKQFHAMEKQMIRYAEKMSAKIGL